MNRVLILFVLFFSLATTLCAQEEQNFILSGTVYDEMNEPVPGANVYVKDKPGVGVTTDLDGNFKLKVNQYDVIVVSFLGYENFEKRLVNKQANLKVTLKPASKEIDEVVVVGMGTQRKISVAGAISSIKPAELDVPSTNIVNTLGGRVPGIIAVQHSGEPGKNISEFWVRGIGTFGASSGALVLIDGLEGDLSQIDAADVESFSVLKDASATAVYGSRGANGVVLVTTKRGLEQKLKITARANFTVSQLKRLPDYVDGYQYSLLANEAKAASGESPLYNSTELEIIRDGLDPDLYPNIDWQDVILNPTSFQQTYYVSAQGGSTVARYFASLGMSNESSAYNASDDSKYNKGVGYDTYNYRLNLDVNLTKTTQVHIGATGYMSVNDRPSMGQPYSRGQSFTDWLWSSQAKTTPVSYPLRYSNGRLPAVAEKDEISPYVLLNYTGSTKEQKNRNMVALGINQDLSMITKGLTAKLQASWDTQGLHGESRNKMPELWQASERNYRGDLIMTRKVQATPVSYTSMSWNWRKIYMDASVNYDRVFGDHRLGGLLFYYMEDTSESGASSSMNAIPKRYQSLSGRFTYGFKDAYFFDFNFGLNGSENFEPGEQFGFFPSGAFAWVPTSYKFMQDNISWLNFLKFRASYGVVGNDRISNRRFPYLTLIKRNTGTINPWGGTGSIEEDQVGANNLMWEKAKKMDLGVDLHLFDDKFTVTLDYFKDTRDGIFQERKVIPDYVGLIQKPYGNVGSMKSWGADGNFEFYHKLAKDMHLTLRGNFTLSKNKILNWEENNHPYPYMKANGYANGVQRGLIALGLFKDQQDVDMSPQQFGTVRPGDIKYKDVNADGKITDDDRVPLFANSGIPQLMYGFGAELRYKDFTLNVLFKGTGKNMFLYGGQNSDRFDGYIPFNRGAQGNVLAIAADPSNRWISAEYSGNPATENSNARFPRLYYGKNENNNRASTYWMGNARYLRLQELSLNYNLKMPALRRILGIQSLDIQLMCENLAVWDSVKLFDPEQANACGQAYPIPARYSLQLYLNF